MKGHSVGLMLLVVGIVLVAGPTLRADYVFGEPVNLGPKVNTKYDDGQPCVSADGLELYFASFREKVGLGSSDLWVTTRATRSDEWGPAQNLGPVINTSTEDAGPALSLDGLELYFHSARSGGLGKTDLWMAKRATRNDPWGPPVNLGPAVNSADREGLPFLSADGLELYFNVSSGTGANASCRAYVSKRATLSSPWGQRVRLEPEIDNKYYQDRPSVSSDGLVLLFSDTFSEFKDEGFRPGGCGGGDLWLSRRAKKDSAWGEPINPGPPLNSGFNDIHGTIAPDGSAVYFSSSRCGGSGWLDVWQAPILPVVDLDQDGVVGLDDLVLLIGAWGTNDPRCDIGPMPWGDGVVDGADLEVLMTHWGQEVRMPAVEEPEPQLVAHWKLDEADGVIAHDSIGTNDANVLGNPIWQPAGGQVDGALQFDGVGDFVQTGFVLNPELGPFSVFAWIKGGIPGQIILSQADARDWLQTDFPTGNLMTSLHWYSGVINPLSSRTCVTDGQWHHVGLVWTGTTRILYVDGLEVARHSVWFGCFADTPNVYITFAGGLHIGAPCRLDFPGYWSGLIDDVRIYKGVVKP